MGGHYGSIHVRANDRDPVHRAVEKLAKRRKLRFLIGPVLNGWVSVYPQDNGLDAKIAPSLAKELHGHVIYVTVYDDDIFGYSYYQDGDLIHSFDSCPEYFNPRKHNSKPKIVGDSNSLAPFVVPGKTLDDLGALLSEESITSTVFTSELLERFANLLA